MFSMVKILRKQERAKKIILWLVLTVMVLAFVLWGAGAYRQGSTGIGYAGKISGRAVSVIEFRKMYLTCLNDARLRFGENYRQLIPYLNLRAQAWTKLALLEYARNLKIKAADQEVAREIAAMPLFFRNNVFNPEAYEKVVRYFLDSSPRDFEEHMRSFLIIKKLYERITQAITSNDEETLGDYKRKNETVNIIYLEVEQKDFLSQIAVTDDELKNYYQANADQFKRPPPVRIEYIGIDYPQDSAEAKKTEILREIKTLYPKIKAAKDLNALAQGNIIRRESGFFSFSETPFEGIESEEFQRYALALREKETSPVIKTKKGVYALRVIQKKDSYVAEFEEVKEKIREILKLAMAKDEAKKRIQGYKNQIDELLIKEPNLTLKEMASRLAVELKTTPQFKRFEPLVESGITPQIQLAAFNLKPGEISALLEGPSAYFLIEQDTFIGIDEEKFAQEKKTHQKNLLEEKRQRAFDNFIQELIAKSDLKDYSLSLNLPE